MEIRVIFSHLEKCLVILMIVLDNFCVSYGNQCSFQNGKCTYEINLSNSNTECESKRTKISMANENDLYGQNDEKMSRMQQDFHTVTEQHKNRIEELEASVQKLLRSAVAGPISQQVKARRVDEDQVIIGTLPHGTINHSESGLLKKLYDEFSNLRTRLHKRTSQLLDTESKLNETTHLFTKAQDELLDQGEKLMIAEHKVATMEQERYILKNQVKHTTEQFKELQIRFNVTDAKVFDLENQLYTLVRSESNLKEELGLYKWKLSQVEKAYGILQGNYSGLQQKLTKTEQTLQKAEFDLMECFTAKTQSFCGFEDDKVCGFTQEGEKDDFDWLRNVGKTPSSGTGPETDHTCAEKKSGHYMFVEASGKNNGKKAILISPKYRGLKSQCLSFYYHMYGEHVGTLNVYTTTDFQNELNSVWRAYGNQGDVWIKSTLEIPKALARTGYRVKFEAVTRLGYRGDISIDDVSVDDGECADGAIKVQYEKNSTLTIDSHNLRRYKKFRDRLSRRKG
ncbi:uncharacterized protein LOC127735684 [Mytilus californianus]|uniref:uncharacterized protein LOC127735684 n=1 Tax=Mytilus californianus TaxID=6549 RepID=UPI0022486A2F|nr:uncharacterized protein LOC127735684 [Mytilus californianus]